MAIKKIRPKREELGAGENLCDYRTVTCCRYFALPIETPEQVEEYVDAVLPRPAGPSIRNPRPPLLPVVR